MGECGCNDLVPDKVVQLGEHILALSIYHGCEDCHPDAAVILHAYTKKDADELSLEPTMEIEPGDIENNVVFVRFPVGEEDK